MHKLCLINKRSVLCIINYKTLTLWILIWTDRSYWHSGISSLAWEFLFSANMAVFICILTYCKNRKRNLDKKKISKGRFQKNMYEGVWKALFFVKTHHLYNLKKKETELYYFVNNCYDSITHILSMWSFFLDFLTHDMNVVYRASSSISNISYIWHHNEMHQWCNG